VARLAPVAETNTNPHTHDKTKLSCLLTKKGRRGDAKGQFVPPKEGVLRTNKRYPLEKYIHLIISPVR